MIAAIILPVIPTASATSGYDYRVSSNIVEDSEGATVYTSLSFTSALNWALSHTNAVVYVPAGTYTLSGHVYFAPGATLCGAGDSTIFTATVPTSHAIPSSYSLYINGVSHVTMANFKLTGYTNIYGYKAAGSAGDWTFINIHASGIDPHVEAAFWMKTGDNGTIDGLIFSGCTVSNSGCYGFLLYGTGYGHGGMIQNVYFVNCQAMACGITARVNAWAVGFDLVEITEVKNVTLRNCTSSGNWGSGFHFEHDAVESNVWLIDCIANNNGNCYRSSFGGDPDFMDLYGAGFRFRTDRVGSSGPIYLYGCSGTGNYEGLSYVNPSATTLSTVASIGANVYNVDIPDTDFTIDNGTDNITDTESPFTTSDYWVLHWYYPGMALGALVAAFSVFTRHWLIFIAGISLVIFSYLYMTSAGVMLGWLTGTGV